MKQIKLAAVTLVGIVVILGVFGFFLPSQSRVERSVVVRASAEKIYPLVANFKEGWPKWSAFDFEDPGIHYSYSGPDSGVGAQRSWVSKKMGNGSQRITRADRGVWSLSS